MTSHTYDACSNIDVSVIQNIFFLKPHKWTGVENYKHLDYLKAVCFSKTNKIPIKHVPFYLNISVSLAETNVKVAGGHCPASQVRLSSIEFSVCSVNTVILEESLRARI